MNILTDEFPPYSKSIIIYLANRPGPPEGTVKMDVLRQYTTNGLSDALRTPISSTYRALQWLEAGGFVAQSPRTYMDRRKRPTKTYQVTENGKRLAEALLILKRTVEELR